MLNFCLFMEYIGIMKKNRNYGIHWNYGMNRRERAINYESYEKK